MDKSYQILKPSTNKPKVFCDTMIWFDENKFVFDKANFEYFGSVSNICDFFSSDNENGRR